MAVGFRAILKSLGKMVEFYINENTDHALFNDTCQQSIMPQLHRMHGESSFF